MDLKDENNLELAWGWWLADEDYIEYLKHKDETKTKQLNLFDNNSNSTIFINITKRDT